MQSKFILNESRDIQFPEVVGTCTEVQLLCVLLRLRTFELKTGYA
jgi:hypothetical protein